MSPRLGAPVPGAASAAQAGAAARSYDVLVLGGGVAGCSCAVELAASGFSVALVEKSDRLGGRVADMGCKAADACVDCGVCLASGLWDRASSTPGLDVYLGAKPADCRRSGEAYLVDIKRGAAIETLSVRGVVAATGYENAGLAEGTHVELYGSFPKLGTAARLGAAARAAAGGSSGLGPVISGADIEALIRDRSAGIFAEAPPSVAFIQCYGSRDETQKSAYCSRVCCSYATRSARLIKALHPACEVDMFFMDLQRVGRGCSEAELKSAGVSIIRARPEKVDVKGATATIQYESGGIRRKDYGLVVLSCGIAPGADTDSVAELFGLGYDADGFLAEVGGASDRGVFVAGCAGGPKRIAEARSDALATAARVAASLSGGRR